MTQPIDLDALQAAADKKPTDATVEFWLSRGLTQEAAECEAAYRKNRRAIKDAFARTRFAAPSDSVEGAKG